MTSENVDIFFHHLPILKAHLVKALGDGLSKDEQADKDFRILEFWNIGLSLNLRDFELTTILMREILQ